MKTVGDVVPGFRLGLCPVCEGQGCDLCLDPEEADARVLERGRAARDRAFARDDREWPDLDEDGCDSEG